MCNNRVQKECLSEYQFQLNRELARPTQSCWYIIRVPEHVEVVFSKKRDDWLEGFNLNGDLAETPALITMYAEWYRPLKLCSTFSSGTRIDSMAGLECLVPFPEAKEHRFVAITFLHPKASKYKFSPGCLK